ncbi:MAG TPA: hypothetical protein VND23_06040, partial [Acidimicrobiales bacterium]|nr:hypothetical protein [Acidimicrobiales bacterium]
ATGRPSELVTAAFAAGVEAAPIGMVGGSRLVVEGLVDIGLDEIAAARTANLAGAVEAATGA